MTNAAERDAHQSKKKEKCEEMGRRQELIDLIRESGFGFLATTEGSQPKVRPMMTYLTEEGDLLLAVFSQRRTINQIKKNPPVEICYINPKMVFCRISGKAAISSEMSKKELLWNKVPRLRQYFSGTQDPNFVLLEIITTSAEIVTPGQKTPDVVNLK